jgi:2-polyprenyl-6-methoxyphenol hydroxylase-like FAD-dependent oxidoreductase
LFSPLKPTTSPRPASNIGIVGGGIGGIAAALALHRAGIGAVVYEKAPRLQEVGAGMMLWPNATRVLRELGVLDEVLKRSGPNTNFLVRAASGKILMDIPLGRFDVPAVCVRRADLLAILLEALPDDSVRMSCDLDHLEQREGKVRLHFRDGGAIKHDAVIGADGIRSRVRAELFGASQPIYRGYTVWRGLARYDGHAVTPGFNSETWGKGKRFGILNTGHRRFTWYATANVPSHHSDGPIGRRRELQKMFDGWHEPIADLLDATAETEFPKMAREIARLCAAGVGALSLSLAMPRIRAHLTSAREGAWLWKMHSFWQNASSPTPL